MVAVGTWQYFWVGWDGRHRGNEIWLPTGSHIDHLPQILQLPIQSFITPLFPAAEHPPSMSSPSSTNPDPKKETDWVCYKDQT